MLWFRKLGLRSSVGLGGFGIRYAQGEPLARHADAAGNEVIVCEADMNVYTQCFSYMGIHIAASRHTDEIVFQQMWQEAKDNMRESDSLQLVPERVSGMQGSMGASSTAWAAATDGAAAMATGSIASAMSRWKQRTCKPRRPF